MRVLLIANTLPPRDLSGVGEQVLQLAAGLRSLGHEVEIVGRGPGGARGPKALFPWMVVPAVLERLRRFGPDAVQVHESDGALAALAIRLVRRAREKRPLLVALQQVSYVEERRAVRPLRFAGRELGRPSASERSFRWLKGPLQILLGRWSARLADLVLAPSRATAAELVRDYGARETAVVPNATGGLEISARPIPEVDERDFWLFVGRLRIRKGVEVLLAALRDLPEGPPLLVAGSGEHAARLAAAARRLGVEDRVRFLGRRDASEVRWLLSRARALIVPSTYEGMPLVVLEAMESAVPVIASRVSGIPEVVVEGETGWLVAPEDPVALRDAMSEALADPAAARRRGESGKRRVEERYRPVLVAATWVEAVRRRSERSEEIERKR